MAMAPPVPSRLTRTQGDPQWQAHWRYWMTQLEPICHHDNDPESSSYDPRPQCPHFIPDPVWEPIFDRLDIRNTNKIIVSGGEGSSKSASLCAIGTARIAYDMITVTPMPRLYWVIGEDYQDADKEMQYISEYFKGISGELWQGFNRKKNGKDEGVITLKGGVQIVSVSGKDPEKIARENLDGIIIAEISRVTEEVKRRAYSRIARLRHAWLLGGGSPDEDTGWFADELALGEGANDIRLYATSLRSSDNSHLYPQGENTPSLLELRNSMSEEKYAARHLGKLMKPPGMVMHGFSRAIHVNPDLQIDPDYPVLMAIDPGNLVYSILFIQIIDGEMRVLDEIYSTALDEHADHEAIIRMAMTMDSGVSRYLGAEGHVIDFAGRQHVFRHKSPKEEWKIHTGRYVQGGIELRDLGQTTPVDDVVNRLRSLMNINPRTNRPFIQVHPRCHGLLSECGAEKSPAAAQGGGAWMRAKRADGTFGDPKSDNNHSLTALAFFAEYHFGSVFLQGRRNKRRAPRSYESGGFGERRPALDYQVFPNTTVTRSDGSKTIYPGKRLSDVQRGGRRMRRGY